MLLQFPSTLRVETVIVRKQRTRRDSREKPSKKGPNMEPDTSKYKDVECLTGVCEALERWMVIPSAE
jgi:hypothetical protein